MKTAMLLSIMFFITTGLLALSSYGTSAPVVNDTVDPSLSLTSPNGGEEWYIGDTNNITWTASDSHIQPNSVYLWYSLNNGTTYLPIAEGTANDGTQAWTMPNTESYATKVRIKVSDSFGNFSQKNSASVFSITYVPPQPPAGVNVNTSNGIDAVISWEAVSQTIYNTPITPDGYIVLYNESPYEQDEHFYYYLGETTTALSFTHYNVARRRSQMYYRVVAYKDYSGRLGEVLASAKAHPEQKLSLAEIKEALAAASNGGVK